MSKWDGRFHRTIKRFNGGKWTPSPRCRAVVNQSGGGYPGMHQCTHTAIVTVNSRALCHAHLKQYLRRAGEPVQADEVVTQQDLAA